VAPSLREKVIDKISDRFLIPLTQRVVVLVSSAAAFLVFDSGGEHEIAGI
jgi:hypothetical protein